MERLFTRIAIAAFAFSIFVKPAMGAEKKFTVLTANVGNMSISSANHKRQYKISEYDLPVLRDNLAALSPDIVFFQEIDSSGKQQEKRIFSKDYSIRCGKDMCTAVDNEKLEFIGKCAESDGYFVCSARIVKRVTLKETCSEEKGGYVCSAKRKLDPGEVIKLFNTHTSSPVDDKDFAIRKRQICGMLNDMEKQRKKNFRVLTAGDFNFDPKYESKAYNRKNDRNDSLFNLGVCWGNSLTGEAGTGLKIISGDDPTWFTKKVKLLVIEEQIMNTLDHVITDFPSKGCRILGNDKDRLDTDRSGKSKPRKQFMDHRAVLCEIGINQ